MKICSKCNIKKDLTDYYFKDYKSGRLHAQCKECYKEHRKTYHTQHYEKYGHFYRERARIYRNKVKSEFRSKMRQYLAYKSCTVCGEDDLVVLELDHINPKDKQFTISQAYRLGYKWSEVVKELKKCQVLCANCHKRRTAKQFGWHKSIELEARSGFAPL